MESTATAFDSEHPLFGDRDLLDEVTKVMHAVIHKTLHKKGMPVSPQGTGPDRALIGGVSADDVLQDAVSDLWNHPREGFEGSWGALGVTIAHRRAVDAVRAARKGLRGTEHRHEVRVVSGDEQAVGPEGELGATRWELHPDECLNPEEEYVIVRSALDLLDLAREVLAAGREQAIFFGIRFQDRTPTDLAPEWDLTRQRVGQIYNDACRRLEANPRYPYDIQP